MKKINQKWVEQWLAGHRPDLAAYEHQGNKGTYKREAGPAASFQGGCRTWREVAARLGAIPPAMKGNR